MTTQQAKRVNRHKVVKIQTYIVLLLLIVVGFFVGRLTAPTKIEKITVKDYIEVPVEIVKDELPKVAEMTYYNVPLSHSLQKYINELCIEEQVPISLVMGMIELESNFNQEEVSGTADYGLMQINECNHEWLAEQYRAADMLNPYQNVFCGIKIISTHIKRYEDYSKALMAYNMGDYGAQKAWENGVNSTAYSRRILELMEKYEQEMSNNEK